MGPLKGRILGRIVRRSRPLPTPLKLLLPLNQSMLRQTLPASMWSSLLMTTTMYMSSLLLKSSPSSPTSLTSKRTSTLTAPTISAHVMKFSSMTHSPSSRNLSRFILGMLQSYQQLVEGLFIIWWKPLLGLFLPSYPMLCGYLSSQPPSSLSLTSLITANTTSSSTMMTASFSRSLLANALHQHTKPVGASITVLYPPQVIPYGIHGMEGGGWWIPCGFHGMADGFHIIPWNFQMDSILFKSDLMPPQNSIQNSYVNIDIVLIIFT